MFFCFTVDDVGLEGYSSESHMNNLLVFCHQQEIRATFFPVPMTQTVPFTKKPEYVCIMREAIACGHEVAQHGIEHDRFEVGIPPSMVLDLPHEGPTRERLRHDRETIEASLKVDLIRRRLAKGRRILEDALCVSVGGFRAPCLQTCGNLYRALEAEGYRYDSSHYLQPTGWDILNGSRSSNFKPISRQTCEQFQQYGKLRLLPLTTEYTWYLTRKQFGMALALARHDFLSCLKAGIPFVPVSHVSPIQEGEDGCGFDLYQQLIAFARETCVGRGETLRFATLTEACEAQ